MKYTALSISFVCGALAGVSAATGYWLISTGPAEVWVSTQELRSESGIVVPEGTSLMVHSYMPEGFVSLDLGISVEGEALNGFEKSHKTQRGFRAPYFVTAPTK